MNFEQKSLGIGWQIRKCLYRRNFNDTGLLGWAMAISLPSCQLASCCCVLHMDILSRYQEEIIQYKMTFTPVYRLYCEPNDYVMTLLSIKRNFAKRQWRKWFTFISEFAKESCNSSFLTNISNLMTNITGIATKSETFAFQAALSQIFLRWY